MTSASIWHGIGRQLGMPSGWRGQALGGLMRLVNRAPNRLALDALAAAPGEAVLELGFGPGDALAFLDRSGCRPIHGIDHSAAMVAQAIRRNRRAVAAGRVNPRQGDFARLPYADGSFDKALAVNVAYFWRDGRSVLGEIRRVLRPGGRLVVYVTERGTMQRWRFASPATHRQFDEAELRALLAEGGFDAAEIAIGRSSLPGGILGLVAVCGMGAESPRPA